MKTLVVYYSRTGNTEAVAEGISKALDADIERIAEEGVKREGIIGWLLAGRDGMLKRKSVIRPPKTETEGYDRIYIGSPVWSFDLVPAIRSYMSALEWKGKKVGLFCTMDGSGAERTFKSMLELAKGARIIGQLAVRSAELKDGGMLQKKIADWVKDN